MPIARCSATRGARRGGRFLLRIEDLDQARSRPEFVDGDLRGPALARASTGTSRPLVQSQRTALTPTRSSGLRDRGLVYPCFCTRADIAAALTAPHGDASAAYPGTCRGLPDDPARRAAEPHSWRLDSAKALALAGLPGWTEADGSASPAAAATSTTSSSPARTRPPPITSPAWSTMRRAA